MSSAARTWTPRRLVDAVLLAALRELGVPRKVIGGEQPLVERYALALIERSPSFPFLRISPATVEEVSHRNRAKLVLHRFLCGDLRDKGIHSHPWWFASIVLSGWYLEHHLAGDDPLDPSAVTARLRGPASVGVHGPSYHHVVVEVGAPCWTLAILGPRVAAWGFPVAGEVVRDANGRGRVPAAESVQGGRA